MPYYYFIFYQQTHAKFLQLKCYNGAFERILMSVRFFELSPDLAQHSTPNPKIAALWAKFYHDDVICQDAKRLILGMNTGDYDRCKQQWQNLNSDSSDKVLTDWLIALFNGLFTGQTFDKTPTVLVRGTGEPEYFASQDGKPARIEFAHGFFASSLHEISHWCIAGQKRRELNDFGYWYVADGRDRDAQQLFEQVEIKPQAVECLLNLALGRFFYVSQDNLNADFDTTSSTFAQDVYAQAQNYLQNPTALPTDARRLIWVFLDMTYQL